MEAFPDTFTWIFEEHQSKNGFRDAGTHDDNGSYSNNQSRSAEVDNKNHTSRRQPNYLNWLRSGNNIYCIFGKAGSGKSTLLRYIVEDVKTKTELEKWAGQARLVTASCFFSGSGESLQKSQQGLLRSLLYEILSHCSDIVPVVCSSRYHTFGSNAGIWSVRELLEAFKQLKKRTLTLKFYFFIDDLNEFKGSHKEIVSVVQELAESTNIKIGLSSRPLFVFLKAFDKYHKALWLVELTKPDVKHYVN